MQNDDSLRERFRKLANEVDSGAPVFARPQAIHRRSASPARRILVAGASFVAALLVLSIGLVVGANTGYASARVEGDRERTAVAANTLDITRQLTGLRLDLSRARSELGRLAADRGNVSPASLRAAEAELHGMEASVQRMQSDLAQSRETVTPALSTPLRGIPMKRALAITCGALALAPQQSTAQQGIPVVELPAASAKATQSLGLLYGIHQISNGDVLVNDGMHHQVKLFDSTLSKVTVVIDSVAGSSRSYGRRPVNLTTYLGDSSLFADFDSQTLLVLDGRGQVARALALPNPQDIGGASGAGAAVDNKGRLVYVGSAFPRNPAPGMATPDSAPVLRADFDSRRIDTLGRVSRTQVRVTFQQGEDGRPRARLVENPLPVLDSWTVLSNGAVAFVRGHDYHVDWVQPDGMLTSTGKLPFDWKHVTDEDKQKIIDSARVAKVAAAVRLAMSHANDAPPPGGGRGGGSSDGARALPPAPEFAPLKEMSDYYPAVRASSAVADRDGRLWILPTTSAQSKNGELVYDVVNTKGELIERVRMPVGRSIVGFGKGGVIYMVAGDIANGFYLERTRLPAP